MVANTKFESENNPNNYTTGENKLINNNIYYWEWELVRFSDGDDDDSTNNNEHTFKSIL